MASETDPLPNGLKTEINTVLFQTDGGTTSQIRSEMLETVVFWTSVFGLRGDDHVVMVAVIFLSLPSSGDVRFANESFFLNRIIFDSLEPIRNALKNLTRVRTRIIVLLKKKIDPPKKQI